MKKLRKNDEKTIENEYIAKIYSNILQSYEKRHKSLSNEQPEK